MITHQIGRRFNIFNPTQTGGGGGGGAMGPRLLIYYLSLKRLVHLCWNFPTFPKYCPELIWDKKTIDQTPPLSPLLKLWRHHLVIFDEK